MALVSSLFWPRDSRMECHWETPYVSFKTSSWRVLIKYIFHCVWFGYWGIGAVIAPQALWLTCSLWGHTQLRSDIPPISQPHAVDEPTASLPRIVLWFWHPPYGMYVNGLRLVWKSVVVTSLSDLLYTQGKTEFKLSLLSSDFLWAGD